MHKDNSIDYERECRRLYNQFPFEPFLMGIQAAVKGEIGWRNLYLTMNRTIINGMRKRNG